MPSGTPTKWGCRRRLDGAGKRRSGCGVHRTRAAWYCQPCLIRRDHRPDAVAEAELGENVADVGLHGVFADDHGRGDLRIGEAPGDQAQRLGLTRGEGVEARDASWAMRNAAVSTRVTAYLDRQSRATTVRRVGSPRSSAAITYAHGHPSRPGNLAVVRADKRALFNLAKVCPVQSNESTRRTLRPCRGPPRMIREAPGRGRGRRPAVHPRPAGRRRWSCLRRHRAAKTVTTRHCPTAVPRRPRPDDGGQP